MSAYPARLYRLDRDAFLLRFPDVPEAVACGESEAQAVENARPVLEAVLQSYVDEGRAPPEPSPAEGAPLVETDLFERDRWRPLFFAGRV